MGVLNDCRPLLLKRRHDFEDFLITNNVWKNAWLYQVDKIIKYIFVKQTKSAKPVLEADFTYSLEYYVSQQREDQK